MSHLQGFEIIPAFGYKKSNYQWLYYLSIAAASLQKNNMGKPIQGLRLNN